MQLCLHYLWYALHPQCFQCSLLAYCFVSHTADEAAKRVAAAASKELREGDGFTSAGRQIVFRRDANNQIIDTR